MPPNQGGLLRGASVVRQAVPINRWGVVLAGGDGTRLRGLTRFLYGDVRPKQFCSLLGEETLLRQAQRRVERSIPANRVLYSFSRSHEEYYSAALGNRASQRIVQPCNRGTAPAILFTLLHILQKDPQAMVAILPCDHYYSSESAFTAALESAFTVAETHPAAVVLLGAQPTGAEVEYGWIQVEEAAIGCREGVLRVTGFQEKPAQRAADRLFRDGALWNTFVMVGRASAFIDLALSFVPGLVKTLQAASMTPTADDQEITIPDSVYDDILPTDFSRKVLAPGATRLVAMTLGNLEWNDLGDPDRVIATLIERGGSLPSWVSRWHATFPKPAEAAGYASAVA